MIEADKYTGCGAEDMIQAVENYMEKYHMIEENDTVIAGVSGGADSVCLLLQLVEYRRNIPFSLAVVHINHLIRREAADDADYVKKLCEELQVPFYLFEEDVGKKAQREGLSTEEAGRLVRYDAFEQILREMGGHGKIAVAHNQNDCAETMLFHLFRGSGLTGMAGILPVRDNIIRPLLCISREEIENYLIKHQRKWCIDSTNGENTYTRNKIRNVLLPYAEKEICKNASAHVAMAADSMARLREYVEEETARAMKQTAAVKEKGPAEDRESGFAQIDVEKLLKLPALIQEQVILAVLERLTPGRKDIMAVHVHDILLLCQKNGSPKVSLPYQLEAVKKYDRIEIAVKREQNTEFFFKKIDPPQEVLLPDGKKAVFTLLSGKKEKIIPEKTYTKWFDYDRILHCLVLRNRQQGDYLTINEALQHKRLKEYLIEEKIPRQEREQLLLLADGEHILWVVGKRISEAYKVTEKTERILQVMIL